MIITKKEVVEIFTALGYGTAYKWSDTQLANKCKVLAKSEDTDLEKLNEEQRTNLEDIEITISEGNALEIVEDKKPVKKKAAKKAAKKKEPEPKKTAKKVAKKVAKKAAKKAAKKKEPEPKKTAKKVAKKKPTRQKLIIEAIANLKKKKFTVNEIAEKTNEEYMAHGGRGNDKEAVWHTKRVMLECQILGLIEVDGDNARVVGKVVAL